MNPALITKLAVTISSIVSAVAIESYFLAIDFNCGVIALILECDYLVLKYSTLIAECVDSFHRSLTLHTSPKRLQQA
jgi:hypothetical protein